MQYTIYIIHPYVEDYEKQMDLIASRLEEQNFKAIKPIGVKEDNKILETNLKWVEKSDGLLAHFKDGWITLGCVPELLPAFREPLKPLAILTDKDSYLYEHYIPKYCKNIIASASLGECINFLEEQLNVK